MIRRAILVGMALLAAPIGAHAQSATDQVGDVREIRLSVLSESSSDDGSSSRSEDRWALIERVVAVHDEGLELEFDLPPGATPEDRARDWQWPARVLKTPDGSLRLLNAAELEARIDTWLVLGGFPREACGHWIFTWNAFKIECDPQSVLDTLRPYDLRLNDIRDGASYAERGGLGPTSLRLESAGPDGSTFIAGTPIDPELVRRERAESDLVVAEIMGEPKAADEAMRARSSEQVTGEIATTLTTDARGRVVRRMTVITLVTTNADGVTERSTSTRTVETRDVDSPQGLRAAGRASGSGSAKTTHNLIAASGRFQRPRIT